MDLRLVQRASNPRCVYCRDEAGPEQELWTCDCGSILHADCARELQLCPTAGCGAPTRRRRSRARRPDWARPEPTRAEPTRAEPTRAEPTHPAPPWLALENRLRDGFFALVARGGSLLSTTTAGAALGLLPALALGLAANQSVVDRSGYLKPVLSSQVFTVLATGALAWVPFGILCFALLEALKVLWQGTRWGDPLSMLFTGACCGAAAFPAWFLWEQTFPILRVVLEATRSQALTGSLVVGVVTHVFLSALLVMGGHALWGDDRS